MVFPLLLTAAAAASMPANDDRVMHYSVRKDDSLENLAKRYFVSAQSISAVAKQNRMPTPRKLAINETLLIPYGVLRWTPVNGEVMSFRGGVRVANQPASVGRAVNEGARIETAADSFVAVRFPDGSVTTLPSNSRVRAVALRRYVITGEVDRRFLVEQGGSEWKVTPAKSARDRFEVRTPVATTAVRGTEFRVTYVEQGAQSGTGVVKGEVGFNTPKTAEPVALPIGFGAVTDPRGSVDKRQLLAAPDLQAGYAVQRDETVSFTAAPVASAKSYLFEIAADSGFLEPVKTLVSISNTASLTGLADGQYFLRVSALDDANLQGFSRTFVFKRKLQVLAASPDGDSGRLKFSWTKGSAGIAGYRFIISNDENLSRPLVDQVVSTGNHVSIGPLGPGKYFWRVVSLTADGDDRSDIQSFDVGAP